MSKTQHSVKLIAYDSSDLDAVSYDNGDIVYDNTSNTLRLMNGQTAGGTKIATQNWVRNNITASGVFVSPTPPSNSPTGQLWFDSNNGNLYVYLGAQWVQPASITYGTGGGGGSSNYTLPTSSTSVLGGVIVDGSTITISGSGVISSTASGTSGTVTSVGGTGTVNGLTLSGTVTTSGSLTLGGTLTLTSSQVTTALGFTPYNAATNQAGYTTSTGTVTNVSGAGTVSGLTLTGTVTSSGSLTLGGSLSGLTNSNLSGTAGITNANLANSSISGVALGSSLYNLTAGTNITFSSGTTYNGSAAITINVPTGAGYSLPTASTTVLGGVKVDGSTVTITSGVITATVPALTYGTRATVNTTTASLASAASATATVTIGKGYVLYSIQVDRGAWVSLYSSSTAQSSDSSRAITADPTPGSGVIAESISTSATTTNFTPAVFGYNNDVSVSTNAYLKIYNNSGTTGTVTVTLTFQRLE
jgi:hypothetical protein